MSGVTTHVLDLTRGRPAVGVGVRLLRGERPVAEGRTDDDGRWVALSGDDTEPGTYRLELATGAYFDGAAFHPRVTVEFDVVDAGEHHHVPLLLSPHGYTTYRGS